MRFREVAMLLAPHKHTFCELHSIHFHYDFLSLHFTRASPSYITVTDEHWRFIVKCEFCIHSMRGLVEERNINSDVLLMTTIWNVSSLYFVTSWPFSAFPSFYFLYIFLLCGLYPRLGSRFFLVDFSAFVRWALNPPDTHVRSPSESCVIHRQ